MSWLFGLSIQIYPVIGIVWNFFLAIIPCLLAYELFKAVHKKKWIQFDVPHHVAFALIFLVWLFFFPNTSYLFTQIRYLLDYCPRYNHFRVCTGQQWVILFYFLYAIVGLPLFLYALQKMTAVWEKLFNKTIAFLFPIFIIPLTALGTLFGLVERLNTWEVVTNPAPIFSALLHYITDPVKLFNWLFFTVALYWIYYAGIFLFKNWKP